MPPVDPVAPGDELPDEVLGPQSFIAVVPPLLPAPLAPLLESFDAALLFESFDAALLLELGLLVPLLLALGLLVPELESAPFEAELLPGGQSVLFADMPPEVELGVPALVPDLLVSPPVVELVSAIAAVLRDSAMIDAAVRRRRFIRCPPLHKAPRRAERPQGTLQG